MAEAMLAAHTPLGNVAEPRRSAGPDVGVTLRERQGLTLVTLIARKGAVNEVRSLASALALPTTPSATSQDGVSALWSGPDQWLLVAETGAEPLLARILSACTRAAAAIDVSDGRAIVSVSGPKARDVLAKGIGIDLHPRAFKAGDVALTPAAGLAAHLWQVDDTPRYDVIVARSYAESFWHWLAESAAEFGPEIVA